MPLYESSGSQSKLVGFSNAEIKTITRIQPRMLTSIHRKAVPRGLNPDESKILNHDVDDAGMLADTKLGTKFGPHQHGHKAVGT